MHETAQSPASVASKSFPGHLISLPTVTILLVLGLGSFFSHLLMEYQLTLFGALAIIMGTGFAALIVGLYIWAVSTLNENDAYSDEDIGLLGRSFRKIVFKIEDHLEEDNVRIAILLAGLGFLSAWVTASPWVAGLIGVGMFSLPYLAIQFARASLWLSLKLGSDQ